MLIHDYLNYFAREQADAPCLVLDDSVLTYRQLQAHSNRLARALTGTGLVQGDRFAVLCKNSMETVIAYLAGSTAGLVPVPLNWRLAPPEWEYIIKDAQAGLLMAEHAFCAGIDSIRQHLSGIKAWISIGDTRLAHWTEFNDFCSGHSGCALETRVDDQDVFYQMYTSGTTGKPKGAMLTHYSVVSNAMQSMPLFKDVLGPGKRILVVMPMFHAGATSFVIGGLLSGSAIVIHREFSAAAVAEALSAQNIHAVNLVPAMIQAMLDQVPDLPGRDFNTLEVMIYGASSISENTLRRAMDIFNCEFFQGFGQTETSACITFLTDRDHRRALQDKPELLKSAGRPLIGTSVRIADEHGRELPAGETGEILMRGPQMMKSYWNLPEASAATIRNGWLHTGDVGWLDDEGYLYVQDRLKDMIISGGENVYSREVENVLYEHPAVMDAAVIGLPDDTYGEAVTAVLVLHEGCSLVHEELKAYCRGKLGGYKIPRQLRLVDQLPRNASGKVLKNTLREIFGKANRQF